MRQVLKGSINVSVDVYIIDSTDGTPELGVLFDTTGIDLEYRRELSAIVDITEVTLAALTTAHADGGFLEIGHGLYRLDVPDLAFATGASTVSIQGTLTGMIVLPQTIQLVDFDPEDGVRLGLTALPNFAAGAAGGLPDDTDANGAVRIVDGTGARELNTNAGAVALVDLVTTTTVSTDAEADIAALNNISTGDVNAQVVDVLKTDTIAERTSGAPTATPTFEEALSYLYMMLTNKIDVDAGFKEFNNNAGTVIWKKALTDDATNYVEANGQTGP